MGYDTRYWLKWIRKDHAKNKAIGDAIEAHKDMSEAIDRYGDSRGASKWYEWEDDMREFSKQFPDMLFTLNAEGTDIRDIWKAYFKNGLMQKEKALILFADFDPAKLK